MMDYLEASGRLEGMEEDTPLCTRHDRAGKAGPALSSHAFVKNLKRYAQEAGIGELHLHQLRHTFAPPDMAAVKQLWPDAEPMCEGTEVGLMLELAYDRESATMVGSLVLREKPPEGGFFLLSLGADQSSSGMGNTSTVTQRPEERPEG